MASVTMTAAIAPAGLVAPLSVRDVSSRSALSGGRVSALVTSRARTVCSAASPSDDCTARTTSAVQSAGKFATALALAAIVGASDFVSPEARADVAGLTPCKESKGFAKREKQEVKKLESRLKLYAPNSAPALAINATIEKTHRRFAFYGKEGLLCGTDGLPHLIVDGDQSHLGEFVYPGLEFLYITGWIGWVGRAYLIDIKSAKKPTEKEIIIDVPLAVRIMWQGFGWPIAALGELRSGQLLEKPDKITVSPR